MSADVGSSDPVISTDTGYLYAVQEVAEKFGFIFFGRRQWKISSIITGSNLPPLQQLQIRRLISMENPQNFEQRPTGGQQQRHRAARPLPIQWTISGMRTFDDICNPGSNNRSWHGQQPSEIQQIGHDRPSPAAGDPQIQATVSDERPTCMKSDGGRSESSWMMADLRSSEHYDSLIPVPKPSVRWQQRESQIHWN
ncbi:hypothetical protein ACLOJK_028341 [Asimina triloba]